ncbi:hypothetical protein ACQR53_10025 [Xanthomonas oryzae]|uniref:hypothetical protein n=1 Tax=Xanthomonas oryzae TaxID=347 RepID=UPI003D1680C4
MIQSPSQGLGAEDANERLHALAAQAGRAHCYLLMRPSDGNDAHATRFRQHIEDAALTPMAVSTSSGGYKAEVLRARRPPILSSSRV